MAEEVLRLGLDPRPAEAGAARFRRATQSASVSAGTLTSAVGVLGGAMVAFAGARQVGAAVQGLIRFDAKMTESLAIMGDVSSAMRGEMADAARQVGEDLNFAAEQGAEAFFFLASAGLDAEQSVAALPAVAEFARAGMFDFATATDLATDAQSALGLTVDDAAENLRGMTRVTDVLVKANTLANASVQQFATALTTEAGAAMKTFSIDVEEGVAVLSAFADQGIKGQTAGAGFSRVLRLMSQAAVNNREEMQALGIEFFDAEGNMRNMADVVQNLTDVLGGMSDEQRAAALESIGFTARVQGIIQPLLGTADAIREYEGELRRAAGTTSEVASNQMQSLENRLGQVRRRFENWRTEMAESTVPAIEFMIDHVDTLADAMIGLATAAGALVAVQVAVWASSAATAFIGWGTAVASLAVGVRTLHGAVTLLKVAIGPAGWVMIGVTAITGAVMAWRDANRDAADSVQELGDATGDTTTTLDEQTKAFERLTQAQLQNQRAQREARAAEIESNIGELEAQLQTGAPEGTMDNLREHRAALKAEEAAIDRINALLLERNQLEGVAVTHVRNRTSAIETELDALSDYAALVSEALDLDLEREGLLTEALDLMGELSDVAEDQTKSLKERNKAQADFNRLQTAALESMTRQSTDALGVGGVQRMTDELKALPEAATVAQEAMFSIGDAGEDSAIKFEDAFVAATQVVGSHIGGLASQVANVVGAFATGGPIAGAMAGAGLFLSQAFGPDQQREEEAARAMESLAQETQRATEALRSMAEDVSRFSSMADQAAEQAFEGVVSVWERFHIAMGGDPEGADRRRRQFETKVEEEGINAAIDSLLENMQFFADQGLIDPALLEDAKAAAEAYEEALARIADRMTEDMQLRLLEAQGRDAEAEAMRLQIQHEKELEAARKLEDKALLELVERTHEAELAAIEAARAFEEMLIGLDLDAREAQLSGDPVEAATARAEAQRERELQAAQDAFDAGEIGEETFRQWIAVIRGEFIAAVEDAEEAVRQQAQAAREAAQAAREAAEAERFRQQQDMQSLQLRILRAQGRDREALQLQQLMELEQALMDGRGQQYLQLLQMAQAEEARAKAARETSKSVDRMNESLKRTSRELNAPQGVPTALLRLATAREVFGDQGGGGRVSRSSAPSDFGVSAGTPSFSGDTQVPSSVELEGTEPLKAEVARLADEVAAWTVPEDLTRAIAASEPTSVEVQAVEMTAPEIQAFQAPEFDTSALEALLSRPLEVDLDPVHLEGTASLESELARLRVTVEQWDPGRDLMDALERGTQTAPPAPVATAPMNRVVHNTTQNITVGPFHITQRPGEDAEALADRVAVVVRKRFQDGGGNLFDTSGV